LIVTLSKAKGLALKVQCKILRSFLPQDDNQKLPQDDKKLLPQDDKQKRERGISLIFVLKPPVLIDIARKITTIIMSSIYWSVTVFTTRGRTTPAFPFLTIEQEAGMNKSSHCGKLIALVVLVSLVFAALTPTAAFAEGDIPEAPPAEEPPAEPEEDVTDTVELLAEAGAVIVQDGDPLPLASQGALDGLCDPDPWYYGACAGGECRYTWADYPTGNALNKALDDWGANKGYGFIYIEWHASPYLLGHYPTIDANMNGFSTLKGLVVDTGSDTPSITGSLTFTNFTAGFTIQGLYIHTDTGNSILDFVSNKGTIKIIDTELSDSYKNGLSISNHTGAVELNRVSVHNNKWYGVSIDNCGTGATCAATGTVKITNSAIYNNGGGLLGSTVTYGGLRIQSGSPIVINGLTVTTSKGDGASILAKGALSIKNSAFTDSDALGNSAAQYGIGLHVMPGTTGSITLDNVLLRENDGSGIWFETDGNVTIRKVQSLSNQYMGIRIESESPGTLGAMTVNISDSQFLKNSNVNLYVSARGAVTLNNVVASGSTGNNGANIGNSSGTLPVTITNSVFSNNKQKGLWVFSNGVITINSVTVMDNQADGAVINTGSTSTIVKPITFLSTYGPNVFARNTGTGLSIKTYGNLVMNNVQAYTNGLNGVTAGAVSGGGYGVGGTILWNGGGAWNNGTTSPLNLGVGAILNNKLASLTKSVTLRNVVFDYNRTNSLSNPYHEGGNGLVIFTNGPVSITNINANGNSYNGVSIRDASSVSILRNLPSGNNTFNNNGLVIKGGSGLYIAADKNVILNRVEARENTGSGAYIRADMGSVTISGTTNLPAIFTKNSGYDVGYPTDEGKKAGLHIDFGYGVKLTNVAANENYGAGAFVRSGGPVSILGTLNEFSGNSTWTDSSGIDQKYGLYIQVMQGAVTLLNFKADYNWGGGIYIDNTAGTGSVTLNSSVAGFTSSVTKGQGSYDGYGLSIKSRGAVTLTKVDISDGNWITPGAYIDNTGALTSMPVKVSLSSFNNNYGYGLEVVSAGAITVSKVTANENTEYGAYLYNDKSPLLPGQVYMPITILNSVFNNNEDSGAVIYSNRTITISSVTANGNSGGGLELDNEDDFASSVILIGKNQFNGNTNNGLEIIGNGMVTISGVEAGDNGSDGLHVETYKQVTISNSWVYGNVSNGIVVYYAPVTINNVTSMGNGYYGLDIEYVPVGGKVKLYNSTIILNYAEGINVAFEDGVEGVDFIMSNVNYFGNNGGGENLYISY